MAIQVGGTTVIGNSRSLENIASVDSTTVTTLNTALTDKQAADATLTALAQLNTTVGIVTQTGTDTFTKRTLTAGTGITVTNGTGAAGNPTVAADLATQAEAEAGTDNTSLMTPLRTAQAIAATPSELLNNMSVQTSGTSFTVPAGVTTLFVVAVGGGGGGGSGYTIRSGSTPGGTGGVGGLAASKLTVTPGSAITYTIGAGGAGSNSASGVAGGTTTCGSISCTGGARGLSGSSGAPRDGANGVGSGGNLTNEADVTKLSDVFAMLPLSSNILVNGTEIATQKEFRSRAVSSTAAILYSMTGTLLPGAGGEGEATGSSSDAAGGVSGCVLFIY
jgi:hypothetical protein